MGGWGGGGWGGGVEYGVCVCHGDVCCDVLVLALYGDVRR